MRPLAAERVIESALRGEVPANYLSLEDLMNEKRHFGRTQDLAELEQLERAVRHGRVGKTRRARASKRRARK